MLRDNPVVKKLMESGEERIGKLAQQLLSNENFVGAVQALVGRTLTAKGNFDKSLRAALSAMNLPSAADLEQLKGKVGDLEQLLASIEQKLEALGHKKA